MATSNIIQLATYPQNTRVTPSSASSYNALSMSFTKRSSTSDLIIQTTIPVRGGSNGNYSYVEIDGVKKRTGITKTYYSGEHMIIINQCWTGLSSGVKDIKFGWMTNNGNADTHWSVLHPNSTDDSRNRQTGSNWLVWEVDGVQAVESTSTYGTTQDNPAPSASAILEVNPSASTGMYWIQNSLMGTPAQVYCDMSYDGGGWMLLAYGYVNSTGDDSANKNIPNLNHNGTQYSYSPTSRASSNGLVSPNGGQQTAVKLTQKSRYIMFAAGSNPSSGGINSYDYVYRMEIPGPTQVTFQNHSFYINSNLTIASVTVNGLKGDVGTWTRWTFVESLGASWSDSFPSGYGFVSNYNVRGWNGDGGPFFPSIHSGEGYTGGYRPSSNGYVSLPDVGNSAGGSTSYTYRGWYGPTTVNRTGQTSIWVK